MRFAVSLVLMMLCAALGGVVSGCGNASCPDGFVQIDGICTLPIDAPVVGMDAATDAGTDAFASADVAMPDVRAADDVFVPSDAGSDAPLPDAFLAVDGCTPATFYVDADGDGFGNAALSILTCDASVAGYTLDATDCDDGCMTCHPGGTETCDLRDNDCAGGVDDGVLSTFYADCDRDTVTAAGAMSVLACSTPATGPAACPSGGWVGAASPVPDCDDTCAVCFPGNTEVCDDRDNDCDVSIDEGVRTTFVEDCDGDGYTAASARTVAACTMPVMPPSGCAAGVWRSSASAGVDCNDSCASCRPGGTEVCDGLDQDCVSGVDNGVLLTFYRDCDGDTYTPSGATTTMACTLPSTRPPGCAAGAWRATASTPVDCFDTDTNVRPNQTNYFPGASMRPMPLEFDYDCDTDEQRRWTAVGGNCPAATTTGTCGATGWEGSGAAPMCGDPARNYITCSRGSPLGPMGHYTCLGTSGSMRQECN